MVRPPTHDKEVVSVFVRFRTPLQGSSDQLFYWPLPFHPFLIKQTPVPFGFNITPNISMYPHKPSKAGFQIIFHKHRRVKTRIISNVSDLRMSAAMVILVVNGEILNRVRKRRNWSKLANKSMAQLPLQAERSIEDSISAQITLTLVGRSGVQDQSKQNHDSFSLIAELV
jgi:hypothetical protein